MSKISKKDLLSKINEKVKDVDVATELMEDVEDSFEGSDTTELEKQIEDLKTLNSDLKQKYKDRFLQNDDILKDNENKNKSLKHNEDDEEPEEPKKFENLFNEKGELK